MSWLTAPPVWTQVGWISVPLCGADSQGGFLGVTGVCFNVPLSLPWNLLIREQGTSRFHFALGPCVLGEPGQAEAGLPAPCRVSWTHSAVLGNLPGSPPCRRRLREEGGAVALLKCLATAGAWCCWGTEAPWQWGAGEGGGHRGH